MSGKIPAFPNGVRLHIDAVRSRTVILAPERTIELDPIAVAILEKVDGTRSVDDISHMLAALYEAPLETIRNDVSAMLDELANRMIVEFKP